MDLKTSLIAAISCLLIFVASTWQARRPREPGKPALFPWHGLQFVALVGLIVFSAHLISLWTGVELKGRYN